MDVRWLFDDNLLNRRLGSGQERLPRLKSGDVLKASVLSVEKGSDALISFGPLKAYARLPWPVAAGKQIQIRIEDSATEPRMVMLADSAPQSGKGAASPAAATILRFEPFTDPVALQRWFRQLVPGQTLEGRITGFEKDGQQLVDFGRFNAFARIDVPVREGQIVPLTVLKSDRGLALSPSSAAPAAHVSRLPSGNAPVGSAASSSATAPIPGSQPAASDLTAVREQIRSMLDESSMMGNRLPETLRTSMIHLERLLEPAALTEPTTALMRRISGFVENSGVYFEKRLESVLRSLASADQPIDADAMSRHPAVRDLIARDLKPNLLRLNQFLDQALPGMPDKDRPLLETMRTVIQRSLDHIEHQQHAAADKPVAPDLFMAFSHLLLLADPNQRARLNVFYAKKGRNGPAKPPRVSLLLEMDRIGSVRTDLWMVNQDLNITFFVGDAEVRAAITAAQEQITNALKGSFNTVAVNVVVSQKRIDQFDEASLTTPDKRQVDLNA